MTKLKTWKNTLLALSMASLTGLPALAQDSTADDTAAAAPSAEAQAQAQQKNVLQEAIAALDETARAIKALQDDKPDEATAALERALGKLEVTLAAHPDMTLAPVDVATAIIDVPLSPSEIRAARNQALRLLKDHQMQLARAVLTGLASEIDISTTYIPLGSYPLALKSAAALIKDDKTDDAIAVLANALNTLVVIDSVLPLPMLNAGVLIDEARGLSEKADRSDEENARLAALLDAIDAQIAKGEALEYGGAGAFDEIRAEMKKIRAATDNGGAGEGLFDKLKELFSGLGRDHAAAAE